MLVGKFGITWFLLTEVLLEEFLTEALTWNSQNGITEQHDCSLFGLVGLWGV